MALTQTEVSKLYVAIFNRASEGAGNKYWQDKGTMTEVANGMLATPDAAAYFGTSLDTNQAFIEHIYKNTLNKTVADDADGIAYWVGLLDSGMTRGEVVAGLVDAADDPANAGDAQDQFNNRVEVSNYTADTVEDAPTDYGTKLGFSGDLTVTHDSATVTTAKSVVDGLAPAAFKLTTATDDLTGSANADTFTAEILTLNNTDKITAGGGTDTLTAEINANVSNGFTATDLEKMNITALGSYSIDTKNIGGLEEVNTVNSAGSLTLNNVSSAEMALGFEGVDTNNITANYASGTLSGTSDKLVLNIKDAAGVDVDVDSGFESIEVNVDGDSDIDALTAAGAVDMTVAGSGTLDIADSVINTVDNLTVTNNDALTLGGWAGAKSITASASTGGIVGGTLDATTGRSTDVITADSSGLSIVLGSGVDNINVSTAGTLSSASNLVKLGSGSDILELSGKGSATFIYAEGGDDTIYSSTDLTSSDLVDGGAGTDTLELDASSHSLIAKEIEKVTLGADKAGADSSLTFTSVDSAVEITNINTNAQATSLTGLKAGSTYSATKAASDVLSVNYKAGSKATTTLDLQKGSVDNIAVTNVEDLTIDLGAASNMTAGGAGLISLDTNAKKLTVNATGAFTMDDIAAGTTSTDENLTDVTITGDDAVTVDEILNDNDLANVTVKSTGALSTVKVDEVATLGKDMTAVTITSAGDVDADEGDLVTAESLTNLTLTSTSLTAKAGNLVLQDATNHDGGLGTVTVEAATNASVGNITADKLDTLTVTGTAGDAKVGTLNTTSGATATGAIGTITMTAKNEASIAAASTIAADTIGTLKAVSSEGDALIANTSTITVGGAAVASVFTDGTVDLIEADAKTAATIGAIQADVLTAVKATSSTTTAAIGAIQDANGGVKATVGTLEATGYTTAAIGAITADALTSAIATGTTSTATLGNVTVTSTLKDSLVSTLEATGKGNVTVGNITVDGLTTLNATSSNGTVNVGAINNTSSDSSGVLTTVDLDAKGKLTVGLIGTTDAFETVGTVTLKSAADIEVADMAFADTTGVTLSIDAGTNFEATDADDIIENTKGDLTVSIKAGGAVGATDEMEFQAGSATATGIDLSVDMTAVTGAIGATGDGERVVVNNLAEDTSSTTVVKGGAGANYITIDGHAGTAGTGGEVTYYGQNGVDEIKLTGGYATSTIYAEGGANTIIVGAGDDTIILAEANGTLDKVKFADTAANNGVDTITGFVAANDKLDLDSFQNPAAHNAVLTANLGVATDVEDDANFLVDIAGGQNITTATGLQTALAVGGEYANVDMAASKKAIFVTAATNGANETAYIFYGESNAGGDIGITLVGTISNVDIDALQSNSVFDI
jgi:hypothetical protein